MGLRLFEYKDYNVTISPEALGIEEFKEIWRKDRDRTKKNAINELMYIFYMCDHRSPHKHMPESDRPAHVGKDVFGDENYKPSDRVKAGMKKYNEIHKTRSMFILEDAQYGLDKLREYFRDVDFLQQDENGKAVHDPTKFKTIMTSLPDIIKKINELRDQVERELDEESGIRGGVIKSPFEDA